MLRDTLRALPNAREEAAAACAPFRRGAPTGAERWASIQKRLRAAAAFGSSVRQALTGKGGKPEGSAAHGGGSSSSPAAADGELFPLRNAVRVQRAGRRAALGSLKRIASHLQKASDAAVAELRLCVDPPAATWRVMQALLRLCGLSRGETRFWAVSLQLLGPSALAQWMINHAAELGADGPEVRPEQVAEARAAVAGLTAAAVQRETLFGSLGLEWVNAFLELYEAEQRVVSARAAADRARADAARQAEARARGEALEKLLSLSLDPYAQWAEAASTISSLLGGKPVYVLRMAPRAPSQPALPGLESAAAAHRLSSSSEDDEEDGDECGDDEARSLLLVTGSWDTRHLAGHRLRRSRHACLYALETSDELLVESVLEDRGAFLGPGEPRAGSLFACAVRDQERKLQLVLAVDTVLKRWQPAGAAPEPVSEQDRDVLRRAAGVLSQAYRAAAAASAALHSRFDTDMAALLAAASEADALRNERVSAAVLVGLDPLEAARATALSRIRSALSVFSALAPAVVQELQLMLEPPQDTSRLIRAVQRLHGFPARDVRELQASLCSHGAPAMLEWMERVLEESAVRPFSAPADAVAYARAELGNTDPEVLRLESRFGLPAREWLMGMLALCNADSVIKAQSSHEGLQMWDSLRSGPGIDGVEDTADGRGRMRRHSHDAGHAHDESSTAGSSAGSVGGDDDGEGDGGGEGTSSGGGRAEKPTPAQVPGQLRRYPSALRQRGTGRNIKRSVSFSDQLPRSDSAGAAFSFDTSLSGSDGEGDGDGGGGDGARHARKTWSAGTGHSYLEEEEDDEGGGGAPPAEVAEEEPSASAHHSGAFGSPPPPPPLEEEVSDEGSVSLWGRPRASENASDEGGSTSDLRSIASVSAAAAGGDGDHHAEAAARPMSPSGESQEFAFDVRRSEFPRVSAVLDGFEVAAAVAQPPPRGGGGGEGGSAAAAGEEPEREAAGSDGGGDGGGGDPGWPPPRHESRAPPEEVEASAGEQEGAWGEAATEAGAPAAAVADGSTFAGEGEPASEPPADAPLEVLSPPAPEPQEQLEFAEAAPVEEVQPEQQEQEAEQPPFQDDAAGGQAGDDSGGDATAEEPPQQFAEEEPAPAAAPEEDPSADAEAQERQHVAEGVFEAEEHATGGEAAPVEAAQETPATDEYHGAADAAAFGGGGEAPPADEEDQHGLLEEAAA